MTKLVFETKRMKVAELGEESSVPDLFGELDNSEFRLC